MGRQNNKLFKNIERYEEEKAKQQESKVYGQKPVKERRRSKKTRVYNSQWSKSILNMEQIILSKSLLGSLRTV